MKYLHITLLLLVTILVSSLNANSASNNKLKFVLDTHESLISTLIDDKADKVELANLKQEVKKLKNILIKIGSKKVTTENKSEYKSKYDKKFREYLKNRR